MGEEIAGAQGKTLAIQLHLTRAGLHLHEMVAGQMGAMPAELRGPRFPGDPADATGIRLLFAGVGQNDRMAQGRERHEVNFGQLLAGSRHSLRPMPCGECGMDSSMRKRPNILLIMSDEHDAAVTGCYGDPVVRTPHLDRLAATGITFEAAYTASPLCVPARQAFTFCQYVNQCQAWSNQNYREDDDGPSLPHAMNAAGYQSYLSGKMHYYHGHTYGFELLDPKPKKGGGPDNRPYAPRHPEDKSIAEASWRGRTAGFFVGDVEESPVMRHDVQVTAGCTHFLAERKREDAPFFLLAGYLAPHFPLIAPQAYYDHYRDKVPMPDRPEGGIERLPRNYQHLRRGFGVTRETPEQLKEGRELYWALTDWFDDQVGQLISALEDSEVADNTIVIYTSDHGENKGDHGLWWKNNMYEHSARVPLIVSWPARWAGGQRRTEACSHLDLAKTVMEIAGAEPDETMAGDSMLTWWNDGSQEWKDQAVSEYYGHNICSGMTMIRQGDWKYIYHNAAGEGYPAERELFNVREDPGEWRNLADDPAQAARIETMHAAMVQELGRDPEVINAEWLEACGERSV